LSGCRNETDTVVFAHAPSVDKGLGKKSPDFWGAYACHHCHQLVDDREWSEMHRPLYAKRWLAGIYETQAHLIKLGLITFDDK